MSDSEPDRCGICPFTFGGWALSACIWHDQAYEAGSWHQKNLSRKQVDDHFLEMLLELSKRGRFQAGKRAQSYIMYSWVRAFGSYWWEGREY